MLPPYQMLIPTGSQIMPLGLLLMGPSSALNGRPPFQWEELPLGWELAVAVVTAVRADEAG